MKIAVRMDDITPGMDWKKFESFKTLLDEYGIKPLIGVVPDNQDENLNRAEESHGLKQNKQNKQNKGNKDNKDSSMKAPPSHEDFWNYIKDLQNQGWIIAMHGYRHLYTQNKGGAFPLNHFSEFAGLPFDKQLAMLEAGKGILESHGIKTDIFMAPAHSYDRNTLKALQKAGFRKITDGFGTKPYFWKGLCFYPISFRLESSLKRSGGITTMVVHTNTINEKDMEKYRQILKGNEIISYGEYLKTDAVKRGFFGHGMEYMLAVVKHILVKLL